MSAVDKIEKVVSDICQMNLLEMSELSELLIKRLNLPDLSSIIASHSGGTGSAAPTQEAAVIVVEKVDFSVSITATGPNRLDLIKKLREVMKKESKDLGIKEAKDMISGDLPVVVFEVLPKDKATEYADYLKSSGAEVTVA